MRGEEIQYCIGKQSMKRDSMVLIIKVRIIETMVVFGTKGLSINMILSNGYMAAYLVRAPSKIPWNIRLLKAVMMELGVISKNCIVHLYNILGEKQNENKKKKI